MIAPPRAFRITVLLGLGCAALSWPATSGRAEPPVVTVLTEDGAEAATEVAPAAFAGQFEDASPLQLPSLGDAGAAAVLPTDEPIGAELLAAPGEVASVLDVSARAADGMFLDQLELDEMPYEASSGRWFWSGGWYFGGESLWMHRSRGDRKVIVQDTQPALSPTRGPVNYTTYGQTYNLSPGARITLGKSLGRDYLDRDRSVEVVFYGGMGWNNEQGWNALADGVLVTPLNYAAPGFNGATRAYTTDRSDLNSLECNYKLRRRLGRDQLVMSPQGQWTRHAERGFLPGLILGLRAARFSEDFSLLMNRENVTPPVPPSEFGGLYTVGTDNWLLGLNIGGELISQNEFFYWGLRGRATPAINFASQSQAASGVNNLLVPGKSLNFTDTGSQTATGFIGDMTLMAGWQLTPNFSLQAGWDLIWIAGIATTQNQLNLNNEQQNDIDAGGQSFINGLSLGFYGSW